MERLVHLSDIGPSIVSIGDYTLTVQIGENNVLCLSVESTKTTDTRDINVTDKLEVTVG